MKRVHSHIVSLAQSIPLLLILCLTLFASSCGPTKPRLHLYCWGDFIKPELIERFEQEHDCLVVLDTFESNESMYAKLKAGAIGYDLVFPSSYFVAILKQQNLLQEIDHTRIPNLQYMDSAILKRSAMQTVDYSIPYMISYAGIAYRKDKIAEIQPTWGIFAKQEFRGRMTMLNDRREVLGAALKNLGHSLNTTNKAELDAATALVITWKKNLAKFESEQYKNGIASAEYLVVQGYSGDIIQVMRENKQVGFTLPEEGTAISYDYIVMSKHAVQKELANAFINFLFDPAVAAENMEFVCSVSPNTAAYPLLSQQLKDNPAFFPPAHILEKSEIIEDLGLSVALYNQAWNAIMEAE